MFTSVSIVIPIFNEEEILVERMEFLLPELRQRFQKFEVILTENGSKDNTKEIARKLDSDYDEIKAVIDDGRPDYGQALINGINKARNEEVIILELDFLDMGFLDNSYNLLKEYDLIIGSKKISPGIDQRPWKRKFFTQLYNFLLRWTFHLKLTETHGLKTFKKSKLDHITNGCVTGHAVYPSEFVIRASRDGDVKVTEIPLTIPLREIRVTRISAVGRLRKTLEDLISLKKALRHN